MGATSNDLYIDPLLSEMAIGYRPEGHIADMIMPIVTVGKQSGIYTVFDRGDRLRQRTTARAPGQEANMIEQEVGTGTYYANNYALKAPVTIEDRANADPIFLNGIINGRTELVLDSLLLDYELRVANLVTSGSNVGSSAGVNSAWNGAGDPLGDINAAIDNVHYSNGVMPNRVAFGIEAWKSFRRDSTVRNLIFGTNNGGGYPNTSQVSQLLDIPNIYVGGAFQNTGDKGLTEALSTIWKDKVLVYYAPESPTIERPSAFYSFRWADAGLPNMQVERHPFDSRKKSEEVEVGYYQDEVITASTYAFLLDAVNSST